MPYEPCPFCGKQPEKLAMRVAQMVAPHVRTSCLACWPCNAIAECGDGQTAIGAWVSIRPASPTVDRSTPQGRTQSRKERRRTAQEARRGKAKEDDESDLAAIGRAMRTRRQEASARNIAAADPAGWMQPDPYHWQRELHGSLLDYWPSKRKWRWRGRTQTGDVSQFIANARP